MTVFVHVQNPTTGAVGEVPVDTVDTWTARGYVVIDDPGQDVVSFKAEIIAEVQAMTTGTSADAATATQAALDAEAARDDAQAAAAMVHDIGTEAEAALVASAEAQTARDDAQAAAATATGAASTSTTKAGEASASATSAAGSAGDAATARDAALLAQTATEAARDAAQTAQGGAEAARDTANTAAAAASGDADAAAASAQQAADNANGFTGGTATALAPGATPTVDITGTAPNRQINLGIPGAVADDPSIAATVANTASATSAELGTAAGDSGHPLGAQLLASYEAKVDRTGATAGQVPTLQAGGTLAFATPASGEVTAADLAANSTADRARGNHTGTQPSASISDFLEAVQDAIGGSIAAGSNMTSTYDDVTGVTTLSVVAPGEWVNTDPEVVRDTIGGALAGAGLISVTVNDAADTITISTGATANATDAQLRDRSTHTGTQALSTITGLGDAAAKNTGTTAGTVAAGDDSRITGAAQKSANLSDLSDKPAARGNIEAAGSTGGGREKSAALSATTGTATGDLNAASIFTVVPTGNITLAFSNIPAGPETCTLRVRVAQGATPRTVTMPTGTIHWFTAQPTQTANKVTTYTLETFDGGTNWDVYAGVEK